MLVKCVCTNCGHSYLADDAADIDCPRCGVGNEGSRNPSDIPAPPSAPFDGDEFDAYVGGREPTFDPQAPPPMRLTGDRFLKGFVSGGVATLGLGVLLGGAFAALRVYLPLVAPLLLALGAGASCRYGFGGRMSSQTKLRALLVLTVVIAIGQAGILSGAWIVERLTGSRAGPAREELVRGLGELERAKGLNQDAGTSIVLDQRITEAQRLARLRDAELEDYLWKQQAQINQPLVAYAKLRLTRGPVVKLGPDADPLDVPNRYIPAILGAELLLALWLASRGVLPSARGR